MTAQIPDIFTYGETDFSLIAITPSEAELFDPRDHGLNPSRHGTACYRGYWCGFEITDALYLENLLVWCMDHKYPPLCGIRPELDLDPERKPDPLDWDACGEYRQFMEDFNHYSGLHMKIPFTGKLLAGTGFLEEYHIHMGFQRAFAYEKVFEFEFAGGDLVRTADLSRKAAEMRERIQRSEPVETVDRTDPFDFVRRSFSLDYGVKGFHEEE